MLEFYFCLFCNSVIPLFRIPHFTVSHLELDILSFIYIINSWYKGFYKFSAGSYCNYRITKILIIILQYVFVGNHHCILLKNVYWFCLNKVNLGKSNTKVRWTMPIAKWYFPALESILVRALIKYSIIRGWLQCSCAKIYNCTW